MDEAVAELPVIIEVRVNEDKVFGPDSVNPALPRGPKEIIQEAIRAWAITLGGHVAIGLGDYPYDRFGAPHHGELIEKVASLARTLGRPVATPDQTREILKMRPRPDLPQHRARSNV